MMPLALILLAIELGIMKWLVPKEDTSPDDQKLSLHMLTKH